jgi:3-keto-disaccharide hydrolase
LAAALKKSNALMIKAGAGLFATVVAPVLVAMALKVADKVCPIPADSAALPSVDPLRSASASSVVTPPGSKTPPETSRPAEQNPKPAGPRWRLFNGQDLTGFCTFLAPPQDGAKPLGKNTDPLRVFNAQNGVLRISGRVRGVLSTLDEYSNYRLSLQYRWGKKVWPPRADNARSSGVLLHCFGPDGAIRGAWPASVRCDLIEGSSGDLAPYGGPARKVSLTVSAQHREFPNLARAKVLVCYEPGQPLTTVTAGFIKRKPADLAWNDVLGYHASGDVERPAGQWNDLECVCLGNRITVRLNGQCVNDATTNLQRGRIAFQSHSAEIFFRSIELQPLAAP